jgi:hypothetical protein
MNNIQEDISRFRIVANEILRKQADKLREFNESRLISGKLARFTVFNAHLNVLKKGLDSEINSIINNLPNEVSYKYQLENALKSVSAEYINEYLCISFVKEEH